MTPQLPKTLNSLQEQFIRDNLMSDEFLDFIQKNMMPIETIFSYYECAIMEVETKFKVLDKQFSLQYDRNPIENIKSRIKSMDSILRKINKNNIPLDIEAITERMHDIAGVRVICNFIDDIYMLADCLLKQDDVTLIEKKDYIKNPKESGYRSLHLIIETPIFLKEGKRLIKVEVQLRTISMNFWASLEHKLRYKKNLPDAEAASIADELRECADINAELDMRMQNIRTRMFGENFIDVKDDVI